MDNGNWHSKDVGLVYSEIGSTADGLSSSEADRRLASYGLNELKEVRRETPLQMFLNQFKNLLVIMLILAAGFSIFVGLTEHSSGEIIEAGAILTVVLFIAVIGFFQEYRAEKELQALKKMVSVEATILRDGNRTRLPVRELVPGDVVMLEAGDRIPADLRIIEAIDFQVDESALTGESAPVEKNSSSVPEESALADRRNMSYMGTHATYGKAKAVVVGSGMKTELGKIAEQIQSMEREKTPLQKKLDMVGKQIGTIVLIICIVVFAVGMLRSKDITTPFIIEMSMVAIALAVAAVPEGLPAVVTVALAKGMREMVKKNAIVKKLSAVETLGSTTVICSDKTGTLTRNEMTVRTIYLNEKFIEVSGQGYLPEGDYIESGKPFDVGDKDLQLLLRIAALSNDASLEKSRDGWKIIGDPTEAALIVAASKAHLSHRSLSKDYPRIAEISFSSERKRMTTIHKTPAGDRVAYVKGGPDIILDLCSYILKDGEIKSLTQEDKKRILKVNDELAGKALRVLGAAFRKVDDCETCNPEIEKDLVFVGLLGMIDPPRDDATKAVHVARKAGIKSVMITGDHLLTAVAIAREMDIYREGDKVLTGSDLDALSDKEFEAEVEDVVIYARTSPQHKLRIVSALKRKGHIVAMTGDGVNDAPALKKADIGISMGVTGTDVAKEAADMILVDDDFASIVAAIEEGRGIYMNIRLFIKYLLSCNIGEVLTIFLAVLVLARIPLAPLQILWMNLLTDAAPALALAWNPVDKDVMNRRPINPRENIIDKRTLAKFFLIGSLIAAGTLFAYYFTLGSAEVKASTMAFTTLILFQVFYAFTCRSEASFFKVGIFSNKYLILGCLLSVMMQVAVIYLPLLQNIFKTVPLDFKDWTIVLMLSSTAFIIPELWKIAKPVNKKSRP